jgi:phage I-like protein
MIHVMVPGMPYRVSKGHGCSGATPWAVVKRDGTKVACHASKSDAQAQVRALYAQESRRSTVRRATRTLAILFGEQLPTEFRLFIAGWNETENGSYLFDADAADAVMSAYREWGVELAIDLEHQMLGDAGSDPTARDARGWCKLDLRADGSLWAVDVRWTPDGAQRLSEKRQRYVSPAFEVDKDTKRVTKMINVAITAMPATHRTPALVAASKGSGGMDPALVMKALDALEKGDANGALEILKNMIAMAAGAEMAEEPDESMGSEGDGAEGQPQMQAAPDAGGNGPPQPDDKKKEQQAARVMLAHMTAKSSVAEQLATIAEWKASHLTLEGERQKLAVERATLESAERRSLCVELVKLGAEFPATVWADPFEKSSALKPRWLAMPIAELRSHVADQRAARGVKTGASSQVKPDAGAAVALSLTTEELAICKQMNCDPQTYASLKAFRDGKKG